MMVAPGGDGDPPDRPGDLRAKGDGHPVDVLGDDEDEDEEEEEEEEPLRMPRGLLAMPRRCYNCKQMTFLGHGVCASDQCQRRARALWATAPLQQPPPKKKKMHWGLQEEERRAGSSTRLLLLGSVASSAAPCQRGPQNVAFFFFGGGDLCLQIVCGFLAEEAAKGRRSCYFV